MNTLQSAFHCLLAHSTVVHDDRLVDQTIQATVGGNNLHLFADAPAHKTPVESGGPVEAVATPSSGHKQQHQHRKRKERYESFNYQSQERKVIRYHWFVLFHMARVCCPGKFIIRPIKHVIIFIISGFEMCLFHGIMEPYILLLLQ
jgi:hypothetical protein